MKVLLLHGFGSNGSYMKLICESILSIYNCTIESPNGYIELTPNSYAWYISDVYKQHELSQQERLRLPHTYDQLDLDRFVNEYDLVIGFSQGANYARLLCSERKLITKKLILIGCIQHQDSRYVIDLPIKPLYIFGSKDSYIVKEDYMSLDNYMLIKISHNVPSRSKRYKIKRIDKYITDSI